MANPGGVPHMGLPNPSDLNRGFSLDALVQAYSAFRVEIEHRPDLGQLEDRSRLDPSAAAAPSSRTGGPQA
jgi:hypothetical protein